MENKNQETMGIVTISARALAQLAGKIAADCEGVALLTDRSKRDEISRFLNGGAKGVYITKVKGGVVVNIYIICRYGANVPLIQEKISNGIAEKLGETGVKIKGINVRIAGVRKNERG